jgi:hypothetical protein
MNSYPMDNRKGEKVKIFLWQLAGFCSSLGLIF